MAVYRTAMECCCLWQKCAVVNVAKPLYGHVSLHSDSDSVAQCGNFETAFLGLYIYALWITGGQLQLSNHISATR